MPLFNRESRYQETEQAASSRNKSTQEALWTGLSYISTLPKPGTNMGVLVLAEIELISFPVASMLCVWDLCWK